MSRAAQMLETYPGKIGFDAKALAECIASCLECAQTCTACADACLAEDQVAELRSCITHNANCADVCAATAAVLSRQTGYDAAVTRAVLEACAAACKACGDECAHHGEMGMAHCSVCADACRRCEQACRALLGRATRSSGCPDDRPRTVVPSRRTPCHGRTFPRRRQPRSHCCTVAPVRRVAGGQQPAGTSCWRASAVMAPRPPGVQQFCILEALYQLRGQVPAPLAGARRGRRRSPHLGSCPTKPASSASPTSSRAARQRQVVTEYFHALRGASSTCRVSRPVRSTAPVGRPRATPWRPPRYSGSTRRTDQRRPAPGAARSFRGEPGQEAFRRPASCPPPSTAGAAEFVGSAGARASEAATVARCNLLLSSRRSPQRTTTVTRAAAGVARAARYELRGRRAVALADAAGPGRYCPRAAW